ncbi:hypothetical protein [Jeotgalibacillus sp. JSM ZJ347]|uniref:hypothetical protein n=1 Tax=Jeotgalibacillus sp. JSM ZJ347 TaxID=3342117 RepID=UPI0035A8F6D0
MNKQIGAEPLHALTDILETITPARHEQAMRKTVDLLKTESIWLEEMLGAESAAFPFMKKMIEVLDGERVSS